MAAHVTKSEISLSHTCRLCGEKRPLDRVMVTPEGPACDSCAIGLDADDNARKAARGDFGVGFRLAVVTGTALAAAMLASWFALPALSAPATGLAAALAAMSLVWGGWAITTGGDGRLVPATAWAGAIRASGGVAVSVAIIVGGVAVGLAAWPFVALAI